MKFILVLLFLMPFAFAQNEIVMSGKKVFIGDLGKVNEIGSNKVIELVRTNFTPKRVRLNYKVSVPELICTAYDYRSYPCGCNGRGGWGQPFPGPGPGRPFPPYGGGWCGTCTQQTCRTTELVYVPVNKSVILKFSDVLGAEEAQSEKYSLRFFNSSESGFDFSLQAPYQYNVKKFGRRFKIKL